MRVILTLIIGLTITTAAISQPYLPLSWTTGTTVTAGRLNNLETGIQHAIYSGYDALVVDADHSTALSTSAITVTANWIGVTTGTTYSAASAVSFVNQTLSNSVALNGKDTAFSTVLDQYYPLYLIMKEDGTERLVVSTSFTAPTLTDSAFTGYIFYRLISVLRIETAGTMSFRHYMQSGSRIVFETPVTIVNNAAADASYALETYSFSKFVYLFAQLQSAISGGAGSATVVYMGKPDLSANRQFVMLALNDGVTDGFASDVFEFASVDGRIHLNFSVAGTADLDLALTGFHIDSLRR